MRSLLLRLTLRTWNTAYGPRRIGDLSDWEVQGLEWSFRRKSELMSELIGDFSRLTSVKWRKRFALELKRRNLSPLMARHGDVLSADSDR